VKHSSLISIRVKHALFQTHEFAEIALQSVLSNEETGAAKEFGKMASAISDCPYTREKEGEVGWIDVTKIDDEAFATVDTILTEPVRKLLCSSEFSNKPGDITIQHSALGVHLIHIVDVMIDTRKSSKIIRRKNGAYVDNSKINLDNLKSGGDDDRQRYYKIDTMGCQMNQADSERLAGQLEKFNYLPLPEIVTAEMIKNASTNSEKRKLR